MATQYFTAMHTLGLGDSTVYMQFYDAVANKMFDFNDDTWQASPTDKKLFGAETTIIGDGVDSGYVASTDLSNMNSTATPLWITAQAVHDQATDEIISTMEFAVVSGVMMDVADVVQIEGGDASSAINAEVVDALTTDTYAEPSQGAPGATISLAAKIGYIFQLLRNKVTQGSGWKKVYADDTTTVVHKSPMTDNGTLFTQGESETGP